MSTATNGRSREHRVRDSLIRDGWVFIMRAAGSRGPADLAMAHPEHGLALIQVGTHNKQLGPADRLRLTRAATLCSALPLLAVCGPGKPPVYWVVSEDVPSKWERWAA